MTDTLMLKRPADAPLPGYYQHYKGPYYQVIDVVRHSETEQWHVLYRTCYGDRDLWVRPLAMFIECVDLADGTRPRFAWVGSEEPV